MTGLTVIEVGGASLRGIVVGSLTGGGGASLRGVVDSLIGVGAGFRGCFVTGGEGFIFGGVTALGVTVLAPLLAEVGFSCDCFCFNWAIISPIPPGGTKGDLVPPSEGGKVGEAPPLFSCLASCSGSIGFFF